MESDLAACTLKQTTRRSARGSENCFMVSASLPRPMSLFYSQIVRMRAGFGRKCELLF